MLKQVSYDYERMQYNTVVSGAMKLLNALESHAGADASCLREGFGVLLRVLYPACPHATWALWADLGYPAQFGPLLDAPWPTVDESALVRAEIELMLQINGKLRGSIKVPAELDKAGVEKMAREAPELTRHLDGAQIKRVIVVPGRLVNVVVG